MKRYEGLNVFSSAIFSASHLRADSRHEPQSDASHPLERCHLLLGLCRSPRGRGLLSSLSAAWLFVVDAPVLSIPDGITTKQCR